FAKKLHQAQKASALSTRVLGAFFVGKLLKKVYHTLSKLSTRLIKWTGWNVSASFVYFHPNPYSKPQTEQ
ncbi:MAG: hypothetical protein IJW92_07495, partial [Clostridia bacterium]|nr:hypothetical protein [Clostridia bacterium]